MPAPVQLETMENEDLNVDSSPTPVEFEAGDETVEAEASPTSSVEMETEEETIEAEAEAEASFSSAPPFETETEEETAEAEASLSSTPPVEMETEVQTDEEYGQTENDNSIVNKSESNDENNVNDISAQTFTSSSQNLEKDANSSLDFIVIHSAEASPMAAAENKENVKPRSVNVKEDNQASIIRSLKKIIFNLKSRNLREISHAKKLTRRDVVDKMSANHKMSINKERKNHCKLLRETKELYEKRLCDVEEFYVEKITALEESRTIAFDSLLETKCALEEQIKNSTETLNHIINIISSYPMDDADADADADADGNADTDADAGAEVQPLPLVKTRETEEFATTTENPNNVKENQNDTKSSEKITQLETEVYEQKLRITCLENKIKDEITCKGQIQQKLAYTELLYRTSSKEKDEVIKSLQDDLANLKNSKKEMENRHKEQFMKYDRMLKRSQAEITVQKREVMALRTQFVPGTPTNFNPNKRKATPSMIKESTPSSSKKKSSNVTFFDESGTKKATLFSESAASFCTAASSRSSPSAAITATPSSKASKSQQSYQEPSEKSTTSSNTALTNSDESEVPVPKSTRVLRNLRPRAAKSKRRL